MYEDRDVPCDICHCTGGWGGHVCYSCLRKKEDEAYERGYRDGKREIIGRSSGEGEKMSPMNLSVC